MPDFNRCKRKKANKNSEKRDLIKAIRDLHGCKAEHLESVPVKETFRGQTVWAGVVQVFRLIDHPAAKKCYAWSYAMEGSPKRKYIAVLHKGPVASPIDAVRAFIVSGSKKK